MVLWYALVKVNDKTTGKMFADARVAWTWCARQIGLPDDEFHKFVDDDAWGEGGGSSLSKGEVYYYASVEQVEPGHTCETCGQVLPGPETDTERETTHDAVS